MSNEDEIKEEFRRCAFDGGLFKQAMIKDDSKPELNEFLKVEKEVDEEDDFLKAE